MVHLNFELGSFQSYKERNNDISDSVQTVISSSWPEGPLRKFRSSGGCGYRDCGWGPLRCDTAQSYYRVSAFRKKTLHTFSGLKNPTPFPPDIVCVTTFLAHSRERTCITLHCLLRPQWTTCSLFYCQF
jgi:hypothetical protein